MVRTITLKRGLDVPVSGTPEQSIDEGRQVSTVALLGRDYPGLKPRLLVEPGQAVLQGEALLVDRHDPAVRYASPAGGRVMAINRGRRRRLESVVIEQEPGAPAAESFDLAAHDDRAEIRKLLLASGAWTAFRTRPFDRVPHSEATPDALFITAMDTRPLAPDPRIIIGGRSSCFALGVQVIAQLGVGPVFLCTGPGWREPEPTPATVRRVEFSGPHPAGLAGTHIHHLHPVRGGRSVWHIGYQDVIAIGQLFQTGRLSPERVVAIAGPGTMRPRLLRTILGANIQQLQEGEVSPDRPCRLLSGSPLDGFSSQGAEGFLGRYHNQISILPEPARRRRLGWFMTGSSAFSLFKPFPARFQSDRAGEFSAAQNGRRVAMLPLEVFERVMPLDLLPSPLLRALLLRDSAVAQSLGCLELVEEDLALCSFVCPAKQDYGTCLRLNLEQIEKEG